MKENMKILDRKLEELNARKKDKDLRKKRELRPGKIPKEEVETWFNEVEEINEEIRSIREEAEKVNYFFRASIGMKLPGMIQRVEDLYGRIENVNGGLVETDPNFGAKLPTTTLVRESTSGRVYEEIMKWLINDEDVRKIGIYGMGGTGKTTVLKHINNSLLDGEQQKFDNVIWVSVSKSNAFKFQDAIAQQLNIEDILKGRETDEMRRAAMIEAALEGKGRYVLILDDIWESYDLEQVGIPEPSLENGCKLVLSTRSYEVCKRMGCKDFPMGLLPKEEAQKMFSDTVGHDVILKNPKLKPIADEIVERCHGVVLAIVTLASSLKPAINEYEWKDTLEQMKGSTRGLNGNEVHTKVLDSLKISYERLKDESLQQCLLYCALYPEDHEIERDELVEFLIVEGMISLRSTSKRADMVSKGLGMLKKLEYASLLENCRIKSVKLHDLVREMALRLTDHANPRFMVEAGVGLKDIPDEEEWKEDLVRVSLMHNRISNIPSGMSPRCPKLVTLRLNFNFFLKSIPDCFLSNMNSLSVLDLSYTLIRSLPNTVVTLVNLTALLLRECFGVEHVPSLENLKALKKLDFYKSGISELPQGMEMLVMLTYLNIDHTRITMIADGLLPKLRRLECLICPRKSGLPLSLAKRICIRGEELARLTKLETFQGILCDVNHLNKYVKSLADGGPTKYTIQLGGDEGGYGNTKDFGYDRVVLITECRASESDVLGDYPIWVPKDVELLIIGNCTMVGSLCNVVSLKKATDFKACSIYDCDSLKHLASSSSFSGIPLFQTLEELELVRLSDFFGLIEVEKSPPSLTSPLPYSSLRKIQVHDCPNVKKLFTLVTLLQLQKLEQIDIRRCEQMVEIIAVESEHEDQITETNASALSKLRTLRLEWLPELESICNGKENLIADCSQDVIINECEKLKRIPFLDKEPCPPPSLQRVMVQKEWWDSLEWNYPEASKLLQPLCQEVPNHPFY
ncbi:probable disease resistance protein At4g27220 [Ziziphus jujuba]|uniref:Probable disease resistance protein At4g27220 n=1 Tax=Ziziphus jujuba TaxID=326968 RepID=A0ABM3I8V5_ZIZJJ|nr:probable disease resistance protein At4g27220 [Ziziphus jujuba]